MVIKWIPVMFDDGRSDKVGLEVFYKEADRISDMALTPPQRIAVLRLLICITQAALDGPERTITNGRSAKRTSSRKALDYLQRMRRTSSTFSGTSRSCSLLNLAIQRHQRQIIHWTLWTTGCRAGTTRRCSTRERTPEGRDHDAEWAALALLTFLNFSVGGKVGQAVWQGKQFGGATTKSVCPALGHTFVLGETMLKTIRMNLLTKDKVATFPNGAWGKPVWEQYPKNLSDVAAFRNATFRLTWAAWFRCPGSSSWKKPLRVRNE